MKAAVMMHEKCLPTLPWDGITFTQDGMREVCSYV